MSEATIHLRVPATTKARWVRQSRTEGQRLTDWITEKVEKSMSKTAQEVIDIIREAGAEDDQAIIATLEDGAALLSLGITDADQEAVEDAHTGLKALG